MASKDLLSAQQIAELQANIASPRKVPEFRFLHVLTGTLSPEQQELRQTLAQNAYRRLDSIMVDWPYPHYHKDRTLEHVGSELLKAGNSYSVHRSMYGTKWMKADQLKPGQDVELQVRSYHDSRADEPTICGGIFERQAPHMAIWLQVRDRISGAASSQEEIFDFPDMRLGGGTRDNPNIRFRGDSLGPDAPEWENLDILLNLLEAHMGLAPNNPHNQPAVAESTGRLN